MKYLYLALAIMFEVIGSAFMKSSNGFTKWLPTTITLLTYICCFYFLSITLKYIPLGVAYAIWGGVGIVLTTLVSVFIFKQSIDLPAILGILLIVSGVLVMNIFSKTTAH